jgi:hypothetical protein
LILIQWTVRGDLSRPELRQRVVKKFLTENPGEGTGDLASKYRYNTELTDAGSWVYLMRPANLKNGFDFLICVEDIRFSNNRNYPAHSDIIDDLKRKKVSNPKNFQKLLSGIIEVYNCKDPFLFPQENRIIRFSSGYSSDLILFVLKWLFIEQDIRYWNYSGRAMLMKGIKDI